MPGQIPFIFVSHDAEECVIGSIIIEPTCLDRVMRILVPEDFVGENERDMYMAILSLKYDGIEPGVITLSNKLKQINRYDLMPMINHYVSVTPTSLDVDIYTSEVKRYTFYRRLSSLSALISAEVNKFPTNTSALVDKIDAWVQELRRDYAPQSRNLILGTPRLFQTNPPRYIWDVNGKDLRLDLSEITQWGKFRNRVIAELNFVPERPKNWDSLINELLTHSVMVEVPVDASEEMQLKIIMHGWFERKREAMEISDLNVGLHVIREVNGVDCYCFRSTPLLDYLKKEYRRTLSSDALWVKYVQKWGGVKHKIRVKRGEGSQPTDLWCLPMDFMDERERKEKGKDTTQYGTKTAPEWF